jgi:hypothetical protein
MKPGFLPSAALAGVLLLAALPSRADPLLSEHFDDVGALASAGWLLLNQSTPIGSTGWFQGNSEVFGAQDGNGDAYAGANFLNAADGGSVSNWLITPVINANGPLSLNFYARTAGDLAGDTLEVRYGVGSDPTAYTTLLGTVVPGTDWAASSFNVGAIAGGHFALRYVVADTSVGGDYIGVDTLSVTAAAAVPEPGTYALLAAGLLFIGLRHRAR